MSKTTAKRKRSCRAAYQVQRAHAFKGQTKLAKPAEQYIEQTCADRLHGAVIVSAGNDLDFAALPDGVRDIGLHAGLKARTEKLPRKFSLNEHIEANLMLRSRFVECAQLWTAVRVTEFAQSEARDTPSIAEKWTAEGRIFCLRSQVSILFPAFQFDLRTRRPYPEVKSILSALGQDYEGWSLAIWFITANDWLEGSTPMDVWPDRRAQVAAAAMREHETFRG